MITLSIVMLVVIGIVSISVGYLSSAYLTKPVAYFTWFLLHYAVGSIGILAVAVLSLSNHLNAAAASIISGIVAYSLGAAKSSSKPPDKADTADK